MVIPGANRGINEAAEEKQKADEQYDAGHPGVKSMSFAHRRGLAHAVFLGIPFRAMRLLRHSKGEGSITECVKNRQSDTFAYFINDLYIFAALIGIKKRLKKS